MNNSDYKKVIMENLLKKYNSRCAKHISTKRRIILKPGEIYKSYIQNNADITEKQDISEAVSELVDRGFITADYLKFSDDIENIYLSEERIEDIYGYLNKEYGVVPQSIISQKIREIVERYNCAGEIVQKYCTDILAQSEDKCCILVPERIKANLKMLDFLENNKENLYVREASVLVYGDSKWFENNNYEEVCTFLRTVTGISGKESEKNDEILSFFHVTPVEQEIFIKGNWIIEWEDYALDISKLSGGISITSGNLQNIKNINVNAKKVMTIENKTSYQRMKDSNTAMMYLGGFANRQQIEFLKKVILYNPSIRYQHFGDIDIGGFLIHKQLCRETAKKFELYCMGIQQLRDVRFKHCLKKLTENDTIRIASLITDTTYREILEYMKESNVKLEQEIVSYYLMVQ